MNMVYLIFFMILSYSPHIDCLVVGSNTAVSRQGYAMFPNTDATNTLNGFGWLENGFEIEDSTTTATVNSVLPVRGDIVINAGGLYLSRDLVMTNTIQFKNGANIFGNGRSLILPVGQSLSFPFSENHLLRLSGVTLNQPLVGVDWSHDDSYAVACQQTGATNQLFVYSTAGSKLTQAAAISTTVTNATQPQCARFRSATSYHIAVGKALRGTLQTENEIQVYLFTPPTTLARVSTLASGSAIQALAWHPAGNLLAIGRADGTPPLFQAANPEIQVYSFSAPTLTDVADASLTPHRDINLNSLAWDPSGNYLVFGTATGGNELQIYRFASNTLTATVSASIGNSVWGLDWLPTGTYIAVGLNTGTQTLRIYKHDVTNGTLTEMTSARIGETAWVKSLNWHKTQPLLAVGLAGTASGTEFRLYRFDTSALTLTLIDEREVSGALDINDVRWSDGGSLLLTGDELDIISLHQFPGTRSFTFNNLFVSVGGGINLLADFNFSGASTLDGHGNIVNLGTKNIIVGSSSSLLLKDVTIYGVKGDNIRCQDNTATLSLQNVRFIMQGTYTVSWGHIEIIDNAMITGTGTIALQSTQQSIIQPWSKLYVDEGITLSYDPLNTSHNLLALTDQTSLLYLNSCTLYSTKTGLQLTNGTMIVDGKVTVQSAATVEAEAILFGNGVSNNDLIIKVLPNAELDVSTGYLSYVNVN